MASWPSPSPVPRMKLTGSVRIPELRAPFPRPLNDCRVSQVNSAVSPRLTTAKMTRVHGVDQTERIFVHSDSSRPVTPVRRADSVAGRAVERDGEAGGGLREVTGCSPGESGRPPPAPPGRA